MASQQLLISLTMRLQRHIQSAHLVIRRFMRLSQLRLLCSQVVQVHTMRGMCHCRINSCMHHSHISSCSARRCSMESAVVPCRLRQVGRG